MLYEISKTIFSKETVLKVAYLWQENCTIIISENANNFVLDIQTKRTGKSFDFKTFDENLKEQQLREMLNDQFGQLHDIIYNKAFERFDKNI